MEADTQKQQVLAPGTVAVSVASSDPKTAAGQTWLKSAGVTAVALGLGFITLMSTDPTAHLHSPGDVLAYTQTHIWGFLVAQFIAPAWRATDAYRKAVAQQKVS